MMHVVHKYKWKDRIWWIRLPFSDLQRYLARGFTDYFSR